jgi:hypothetical protein
VTPAGLAAALATLPVTVEGVGCRFAFVPLSGYGDPGRPATFVELAGRGCSGFGELVSFSAEEHAAFAGRAPRWLRGPGGRVGDLLARPADGGTAHERAALEGALIDLALRQAGLALADLCGQGEGRLRWVASFGPTADPRPLVAAGSELKLDLFPGWSDEVVSGLRAGPLVILDWKEQGSPEQARRLSAALPDVIFEDPPDGSGHPRIARDRSLTSAADVRAAVERGELANLKAPRMGGFLELLQGFPDEPSAYFGGMYEVGPGREQARQLAAIFCGRAPNDLAPFAGGTSSLQGPSPSLIALGRPGFGSNREWAAGPGG